MASWNNTEWTYVQVLEGETGIYYMKDDLLFYSTGVKTMQTKLNSVGFSCGTPDGKFGENSDNAVRNFQHAYGLIVDGKAGKGTLKKLDSVSSGGMDGSGSIAGILKEKHGALLQSYANAIDVNVLGAFILVESSGSGFSNGKLVIRLENHKFINYAGYKDIYFSYGNPIYKGHMYRTNKEATWITCHTCQAQEYDAFNFAKTLNSDAVYKSVSMGLGQIMGFNYNNCGYSSAKAMYDDFITGEDKQIRGIINLILNNANLLKACKDKNYSKIAYYYNGSGAVDTYGPKLEVAYTLYKNA